jgi:glycine cleavage system aminomethyltransferase T
MQYGWGRGAWFDAVAAEHKATREAVTVVDETSFGKFLVQGRDAGAGAATALHQRHRRAGRADRLYGLLNTAWHL